jgi:hypothetical protein
MECCKDAQSRSVALACGDPCSLALVEKRIFKSHRQLPHRLLAAGAEREARNLGAVAILFPAEGATVRRLRPQRKERVFERYPKIGLVGFGLGRRASSEA